jgi:hypothetical protein
MSKEILPMNRLSRRKLASMGLSGAALAALGACSSANPLQTVITVNLTNAQAEAGAIYTALGQFVPVAQALVSSTISADIGTSYTDLNAAVKDFQGLSSGSATVVQFAQAVIKFVQELVSLIPSTVLPLGTSQAITLGLALLSALIGGVAAITVPTTTTTTTASAVLGAAQRKVIQAPIPIPLS